MQTKLTWYLNPFYPVWALATAWLLCSAGEAASRSERKGRKQALIAVTVLALGTAQGRLLYEAYRRDDESSLQRLLEHERDVLRGQTVFASEWNSAERFVAQHLIGATIASAAGDGEFLHKSKPGDFLVATHQVAAAGVERVRQTDRYALYRRTR
jgi:hypothetical protein